MDDHNKPTPTPFDHQVIAPAPVPATKKAGELAWMGRPIAHADHAAELEQQAAINEFGLKMPRQQAEEAAHAEYAKRQRIEASAHHLAGMRAAHAAGDIEAARKHGLMYNLHSKALSHEPVGPAHPDVVARMAAKPGIGYRFKPHRGDVFALNEARAPESPVTDSLGKTEALRALHATLESLLKGEVVGKIGGDKAPKQPKHKAGGFHDIGIARARKELKATGTPVHPDAPKYGDYFRTKKSELSAWAESELAARKAPAPKKKTVPCVCPAYAHPHRHGGGKCGK